jgi:hypothetical protein
MAWIKLLSGSGGASHRPIRIIMLAVCLLVGAATHAIAQTASSQSSLAAWAKIQGVLQHPRCLNCHQAESPLQGDSPRAHIPHVVRGPRNHGVTAMKCENCHNEMGNNLTSGTPGAPHWELAPLSMLWQGLSGGDLCRSLKNPAKNGNRSLEKIIVHMDTDKLVLWGWNPGPGREAVPLAHDEFIKQVRLWVDGGAVCPK